MKERMENSPSTRGPMLPPIIYVPRHPDLDVELAATPEAHDFEAPAMPPPAAPERSWPVERDEHGNVIDWSRPETLRTASGVWIAIWLLVPLLCCMVYGYLTR